MDGVIIWIVRILNKREIERKINLKKKKEEKKEIWKKNDKKERKIKKERKRKKEKKERKRKKGEDKDCMIMWWLLILLNDVDFWVYLYVIYCFDLLDISICIDFYESFYNICVDVILFVYYIFFDDGIFLFFIYNNVIFEIIIRVRLI